MSGPLSKRTRLFTTTVRFDHDLWSEVERRSDVLGVKRSAFVRDAVRVRVTQLDERDRWVSTTDELSRVARRVDEIEAVIDAARRRVFARA